MHKLSEVKCRLNFVISLKLHIVEIFKVEIYARTGTTDASKTISHRKMLHYWLFIDITVNNYNLPRSLKGAVHTYLLKQHLIRNCAAGCVHTGNPC